MSNERLERVNSEHILNAKSAIRNYKDGLENLKHNPTPTPFFSKIGRINETKENYLDLSHILLTDAELTEILPELSKLPLIIILNLGGNEITGAGIKKLLEYLPNLQSLNLWRCYLSRNEGCKYLAQFPRLRELTISKNGLTSADLDHLRNSNSLLHVNYTENRNIDIVSKGRLAAALAFNEQLLLPTGGRHNNEKETIQREKEEFVRVNFEKYRRKVQADEKLAAEFRAVMNPIPRYSDPGDKQLMIDNLFKNKK